MGNWFFGNQCHLEKKCSIKDRQSILKVYRATMQEGKSSDREALEQYDLI